MSISCKCHCECSRLKPISLSLKKCFILDYEIEQFFNVKHNSGVNFFFFFAFIFRTKSFFFSFLNDILLFNFLYYCIALKEQNSHHNFFFRCCLEFRERCPSLWAELFHKYKTKSKKNFLSICVKWCLKCIRFPKSYFAIWIHHHSK